MYVEDWIMKHVVLIFLSLTCSAVFFSCKNIKENLEMTITPSGSSVLYVTGGDTQVFTITAKGPAALSKLIVQVQDNSTTRSFVMDSVLNSGNQASFTYSYVLPKRSTAYTATLFFTITDAAGKVISTNRSMYVTSHTTPVEVTGVTIYTAASGKEDAYDLTNLTTVSSASASSSDLDITDVPNGTDAGQLSYSWTSGSGATFVRSDGFDFTGASVESIQTAFLSGFPAGQMNGLNKDAILLVRTEKSGVVKYYAVWITDIVEDVSGTNDLYQFRLKY